MLVDESCVLAVPCGGTDRRDAVHPSSGSTFGGRDLVVLPVLLDQAGFGHPRERLVQGAVRGEFPLGAGQAFRERESVEGPLRRLQHRAHVEDVELEGEQGAGATLDHADSIRKLSAHKSTCVLRGQQLSIYHGQFAARLFASYLPINVLF
ncbi:hypothetical protein PLANTIT3_30124 [Plantibacter sp. T3]|nr:hypothetical protein PLANTIT3_30124 [Plantibacter sp. T3]